MAEKTETKAMPLNLPLPTWLIGLIPLLLLALLLALFLAVGPLGLFPPSGAPPLENLTFERVTFHPGVITVQVINGGVDPVTVAQVMVNDHLWEFEIQPKATLQRLERATIRIPYPWDPAEPVSITVVSGTGLTFEHEIEVATVTPAPGPEFLGIFALLGIYAGVIPVYLGLLWYPFLRRIGRRWMNFFLGLTAGLLLFLGIDALKEALEVAPRLAAPLQGVAIISMGFIASFLFLLAVGQWSAARAGGDEVRKRLTLAYFIALGIGLHNLGEGLAIGAAYTLGELALGAFLIIGFTLHNTTEGLAIVAPVAKDNPRLGHLLAMGALAGVPTILGTWIGGFIYSDLFAALFLAIGAGAIFQVVYEVVKLLGQRSPAGLAAVENFAGLMAGLLIMYLTGLFVVA